MSSFGSGRRGAGRRAAASLAAVVLLASVAGAVVAGNAVALGEHCSGEGVKGFGAFLQTRAHGQWGSAGEQGFNGSGTPLACSGSQGSGGSPKVAYTPVPSAAGLHAWGADDGVLHGKEFPFIGTDIAPAGPVGEEGTMLSRMKAALGSDVLVIPVAQTAIAIAANPPVLPAHEACAVPRVSAAQLQKVFSGQLTNWRQLNAASDPDPGGDCDQAITRVVREGSAGTTYQFKHYLHLVEPEALPCTGKTQRGWAQLQAPFGAETPPNLEWPTKADCQEGEGPVTAVASKTGEGEVGPLQFVDKNPGTISYASLPEAQKHAPERVIKVYNGAKFAEPAVEGGRANCAAAKYELPEGIEKGTNVDWSQSYGSDPKIGETSEAAYPICTLTWVVAAADSVGVFGNDAATTVADYLDFVVKSEDGQASVRPLGYEVLTGNVLEAAHIAVDLIGGEEGGEEEEEGGGGGSGTVLCKASPEPKEGTLVCPSGEGYSGIVLGSLEPETVATFKSTVGPEGTISCASAAYSGKFGEDGTSPAGGGITSLEFGNESSPCSSTLEGEPEPVLDLPLAPYDASKFVYLGELAPQGAFVLSKLGGLPVVLSVSGGLSCYYTPTFLSGQVVNGSPTRMIMSGSWELAEGNETCPGGLQQSSNLTVTQPEEGSLYVAGE